MTSVPDTKTLVILLNLLLAMCGIIIVAYSAFKYTQTTHAIRTHYIDQAHPSAESLAANDAAEPANRNEANELWAKKLEKEKWMIPSQLNDYNHFAANGLLVVFFLLANAVLLFSPTPWASHIFGIINGILGVITLPLVYAIVSFRGR